MSLFRKKQKFESVQPVAQEQSPIAVAAAANLAILASMREQESPEEAVSNALAKLKASVESANTEIRANAPPKRLAMTGGLATTTDKKLLHLASHSERLIIEDDAQPRQAWINSPSGLKTEYIRGRQVTVMGAGRDDSRPLLASGDIELQRGSATLFFVEDGPTLYHANRGDYRGEHWIDIVNVPPDDALALVEFTTAQVEAHRQNP